MIKRAFSTFVNSYTESLKLQERYRLFVTRLGWLTVAISCLALLFMMFQTWSMFGLPLEGGSIDGLRLKLILWVVVMVVLAPIIFFAGMVLVNGFTGLVMYVFGKLTWTQFIAFSVRANYPASWYKTKIS